MTLVSLRLFRVCCMPVLTLLSLTTLAQIASPTVDVRPPSVAGAQQNSDLEQAILLDGPEPAQKGFNLSEALTTEHDSGTGWLALTNTVLAYRFNSVFSSDIAFPYYLYRVGYINATKKNPNPAPQVLHGEAGDLALATHAEFHPQLFDYTATVAATVPTGDSKYGLSTGRATYNLNNHFEREYGWLSPEIELGLGDGSSLSNRRVKRVYTTLGTLVFFQAGASAALPRNLNFQLGMYEQMPIGSQKVFTIGKRHKNRKIPRVLAVDASDAPTVNSAEDNGLNAVLSTPIGQRLSLSAYYNQSLRQHTGVAGLTLTLFAKSANSTPH